MAQEDAKGWIMQMAQAKLPQCHRGWGAGPAELSPSSRSSSGPWDVLSTLPPTKKSNWNHQTLKINPSSSQTSPFECMEESFDAKPHLQHEWWAWFLLSSSISAASASPLSSLLWHPKPCHTRTASNPAVLVNFTSSSLLIITKSRPGQLFHLFFCGGGCNIAELKVHQCLLSSWEQELSKNILFRASSSRSEMNKMDYLLPQQRGRTAFFKGCYESVKAVKQRKQMGTSNNAK